jgi:hypothetical protein
MEPVVSEVPAWASIDSGKGRQPREESTHMKGKVYGT